MTQLNYFFFFLPAVMTLIVMSALLHECLTRWRLQPRSAAERKAMTLLRSWLTPEQDKQWATRREFDVVGCDSCGPRS
jgi:hypothetical protein